MVRTSVLRIWMQIRWAQKHTDPSEPGSVLLVKSENEVTKQWKSRFSYYICLMKEGSGEVMSKTEGQTFRYRFGNETKTFWYRSRIPNRLFRFGPESALLDQIEMYLLFRWGRFWNKLSRFVLISC